MNSIYPQSIERGGTYEVIDFLFAGVVNFSTAEPLNKYSIQLLPINNGYTAMVSRPFFSYSVQPVLRAPSRIQLENIQKGLIANVRDSLRATVVLAIAGVLAVFLLEAWNLPATTTIGLQELTGVVVFATCTWLMYERGEKKLRLYYFEPADHTMTGEIRALLNRLPGGAAYQEAINTEARAYTTGEVDEIRNRARQSSIAE